MISELRPKSREFVYLLMPTNIFFSVLRLLKWMTHIYVTEHVSNDISKLGLSLFRDSTSEMILDTDGKCQDGS